ncbi:protein-disulfide reductase DsbD domain-containing protein [Paracoccus sp. SMMA_5]|uniref:protein-disulfide reductase DsbD domain-containing protein n=2 Tax=unclassified Paracoccus (in: a-proteobacteria) TaxID=2688777 RepID=UPI0012B34A7D|nr:protein-disulfide reductase DsbD domain-containing protein [Paracoccus sp. SMMA_5]UXU75452.1 protein-disulfide reductase DsbD family protein [Paracoccus sp. SMMA_5]
MRTLAMLCLTALPVMAQDLPPGLVSAELLPGWETPQGHRITALRLELEPGWKTYWRSPGDAGMPPRFDWQGSANLAQARLIWPRPEVIDSGGERTLGYHRQLLLPIELLPAGPGPIEPRVTVDFGLCLDICVPAQVALVPPPPGADPDPRIQAAMALQPRQSEQQPDCRIDPIADGMQVTATLPSGHGDDDSDVAIEMADEQIWVSAPELGRQGDRITARAELVAGTGKPFAVDPADLRLTLIDGGDAVEFDGCRMKD